MLTAELELLDGRVSGVLRRLCGDCRGVGTSRPVPVVSSRCSLHLGLLSCVRLWLDILCWDLGAASRSHFLAAA